MIMARDVIVRMRDALGVTNDAALADAVHVSPTAVHSWRTRNHVPYRHCVNIAVKQDISLDFLILGRTEQL